MKPSQLIALLTVLVPARKNVLIKGKQGGGKTSICEQVAAMIDYDVITWHPITSDPVDFKGFPYMVDSGKGKKVADFAPYGDLAAVINPKRNTLCIIDDLGQAPTATQAAVMHPLLAREINGHKVSDKVSFVACTNRREDKAGVTGLIAPLIDRFVGVYQLDPNANDWVQWGLTAGVPPVLLAFIKMRPSYIEDYTSSKDLVKTTSPRTLYEVGEMIKLGILGYDELAGAAGEAFATEFLGFYQTFGDLPDRDEIIMNPRRAPIPPENRPDVLLALMGALAHVASADNIGSIVQYLDRLPPEYAVCCIKNAIARDRGLVNTSGYISFVTKNAGLYGLASN